MKIPAHSGYRPSVVEWSEVTPDHWGDKRLKQFSTFIAGGTPDSDRSEFWDDANGTPWIAIGDMSGRAEVTSSKKAVTALGLRSKSLRVGQVGTILFAMYASVGEVSRLQVRAVWNQALLGITTDPKQADGKFVEYALRSLRPYLSSLFRSNTQNNLNAQQVGNLRIPIPPIREQQLIVTFLDRETAQIDELIAKQNALIALLAERRKAVITRAVTKGLDPNVELRESGSMWLGQIPRHWDSSRIGRLCKSVSDGPHFSPTYVDQGVMFLSARNVKVNRWSLDDAKFISEEDFQVFSKRVVPEVGDVLYTKGGTTGIARAVDFTERFQVWVHIAVLKLNRNIADPAFVAYLLNSDASYQQSQLFTRGATNQDLGLTRLVHIEVAVPPVAEQLAIAKYLDSQTSRLDQLIIRAERVIALVQERRSALITAAVTGKIDVRGEV